MSNINATIENSLKVNFGINKVSHTKKGFKINLSSINGPAIQSLARISPIVLDLEIKRSGTGLVIIIELKEEDR